MDYKTVTYNRGGMEKLKYDIQTGITKSYVSVGPSGETTPVFRRGSHKSQARLKQLDFDPIEELVMQYNKLKTELARQEQIRDGTIVELTAQGKPKAYRVDIHLAVYDKLREISKELLRYGYGRVPELNVLENVTPRTLQINLTAKGEVFKINGSSDSDDDNTIDMQR